MMGPSPSGRLLSTGGSKRGAVAVVADLGLVGADPALRGPRRADLPPPSTVPPRAAP